MSDIVRPYSDPEERVEEALRHGLVAAHSPPFRRPYAARMSVPGSNSMTAGRPSTSPSSTWTPLGLTDTRWLPALRPLVTLIPMVYGSVSGGTAGVDIQRMNASGTKGRPCRRRARDPDRSLL